MKIRKSLLFLFCLAILFASSFQQSTQSQKPAQPCQNKIAQLKSFFISTFGDPSDYILEISLVSFFIIYLLNYFLGKSSNEKYANRWIHATLPAFRSEFSQIGVSQETGELLEVESANCFKFYASGRKHCVYNMVTLEFKRRQDLISMLVSGAFKSQKDRVRIEIAIDTGVSLPFLLAIVKRKESKFVHDNYPDFKQFCRRMTHDELEGSYVILGEDEEVSEYVLSSTVIAALKKYKNVIEMISFTDQKKPHKQLLRVDMQIPKEFLKNPQEFQEIIKIALLLVDHIVQYKMSNATKVKAEKARQEYEATKDKETRKEKQQDDLLAPKKKKGGEPNKKEEKKMQKKFVKAD